MDWVQDDRKELLSFLFRVMMVKHLLFFFKLNLLEIHAEKFIVKLYDV